MEHNEQHRFLSLDGNNIYCVDYTPEKDVEKSTAIILCKPIWGERIRTHRIYTNLARSLRKDGYYSITCDYFGDGNSDGDSQEMTFSTMMRDINGLIDRILEEKKADHIILLGIRLGADIALHINDRQKRNIHKILIEPVLHLNSYLNDVLRANLTTQMAVHKKVVKTREMLIEEMKNGAAVNIDGFLIDNRLWESFEKVDRKGFLESAAENINLVVLNTREKLENKYQDLLAGENTITVSKIKREFIWTGWKYYKPKPDLFFENIKTIIGDISDNA